MKESTGFLFGRDTLQEARQAVQEDCEKGIKCPCCDQFVKMYKRKLNSGMALTLIRIYRYAPFGWIHVKNFLREHKYRDNQDWTRMANWGLIKERAGKPEHGGKTYGEWRLTEKGRQFARNEISVPKRILLYNNRFLGFDDETTTIVESLGNHFNYRELMGTHKL